MTGERLDPCLIQLMPPLAALVPPATVIDKAHYSPFKEQAFLRLRARARLGTGALDRRQPRDPRTHGADDAPPAAQGSQGYVQ